MMRERWCRNCRGWHRDGQWPQECYQALYARPEPSMPLPFIRRDHMDAVQAPWGMSDSRSEYERGKREYLAENPSMIDLGTEKPTADGFSDSDDVKSDVIAAMKKVEQGYKPATGTGNAETGWVDPT